MTSSKNRIKVTEPTILIIDSSLMDRRAMGVLLSEYEVNVLYASDGPEAVALCNDPETSIDLIFMDVSPAMDGTEVVNKIREISRYQSLPVIAITGTDSSERMVQEYISKGFSGFSAKPVHIIERLLGIIEKFVPLKCSSSILADRWSFGPDVPNSNTQSSPDSIFKCTWPVLV